MYKVLMEDPMNFNIHGTYQRVNWEDEYDVLLETCLHRQRANHTPELLK